MKLLLKAWSSDEDFNDDIEFVFVDITKELAQTILKRAKAFKELAQKDDKLVELCFFDSSPIFLTEEKLVAKGITEVKRERIEDSGQEETDKDFAYEDGEAVELCRMLISEDYVIWEADPKYTNITISSDGIDLAEIEKAL